MTRVFSFGALIKMVLRIVLILLAACGVFSVVVNIYMIQSTKNLIYSQAADVPEKFTVIIPGAKVYQNTVSHVVRDRLEAAINLVHSGKCERYLVSGDHGRKDYDEVNGIKNFMCKYYSVEEDDIFLDHAGFSTYETMYRARDVFCVEDAVVVTQKCFAPRTAYIANKLGLDAVVYEAPEINRYASRTKTSWALREYLARVKAFLDVAFKAKPKFLGDKIPVTGDASLSWD